MSTPEMSVQEQLMNDLKSAMKAGETLKRDTIRMLLSQLKYAKIDGGHKDLSSDDEISVLMNAAKKRKEAIEIYLKSDRKDLLEKEQHELDIISEYLPRPLSEAEVEKLIDETIRKVGATTINDMGKVMSVIMKETKGKTDGKKVQDVVRQKLGQVRDK